MPDGSATNAAAAEARHGDSGDPGLNGQARTGWDPYEIWRERILEPRLKLDAKRTQEAPPLPSGAQPRYRIRSDKTPILKAWLVIGERR
jgi:hypothetical protein